MCPPKQTVDDPCVRDTKYESHLRLNGKAPGGTGNGGHGRPCSQSSAGRDTWLVGGGSAGSQHARTQVRLCRSCAANHEDRGISWPSGPTCSVPVDTTCNPQSPSHSATVPLQRSRLRAPVSCAARESQGTRRCGGSRLPTLCPAVPDPPATVSLRCVAALTPSRPCHNGLAYFVPYRTVPCRANTALTASPLLVLCASAFLAAPTALSAPPPAAPVSSATMRPVCIVSLAWKPCST